MATNQLIASQACPMTASVNWNPDEDTREITEAWFEVYLKLPLSIKYGLSHLKVQEAVTLLSRSYRIEDPERIGEISRIVREVFMKGLREGEIKQRVMAKLGLSGHGAEHFMIDLRKVITFVKKVGEMELKKDTEQIKIIDALKKYIKFGDQRVTERFIKLKMFDQPVEPTVKNWLEDYFSRIGTDKHTSIQRTDYLFNSENGKSLSSTDREKISIILKSYDTGETLMLDKETQEVVYAETFSESQEKTGLALPIEQSSAVASRPTNSVASSQSRSLSGQGFPNGKSKPTVIREKDKQQYKPFAYPPSDRKKMEAKESRTVVDPKKPTAPLILKPLAKDEAPREMGKNVVDLSDYM